MSRNIVTSCCLVIALAAEGGGARPMPSNPSYVLGGVGEESRDDLEARAGQYDVHVIFALRGGAYVAD
ncbi:MAG TPA: hypothetical protein VJ891_11445, partial [Casimicrobiaceae bacterium]|nr:hypothetical protein [Casimicrobiaceae bacterium]